MAIVFQALQVIIALGLILLTAVTTTKSEQSGGGGMGWGMIGGKSSSSIAGLEDQLTRLTTYLAAAFLVVSLLVYVFASRG
jgi:preprotein translocase subunit SecG